ncbi:MAG: dihydropteroate synthase [Candidatus Altiarchaeales archaeon ex4484_2]|nr:MAG: dihydropteroate synthase [Candidatus Altiarchaeales archaeon ex4484_2]
MMHVKELNDVEDARRKLREIGAGEKGVDIMAPKAIHRVVKVYSLDVRAASILKQEMLSLGGEAAVSWGSLERSCGETDVLLMATLKQYGLLKKKLLEQPFGLREMAGELDQVLSRYSSNPAPLTVGDEVFDWSRTYVMGVLNITPDSFSGDGLSGDLDTVLERAARMVDSGVDLLDVGGESTKPGSRPVPVGEEMERVVPVVAELSKKFDVPVSVDTYKVGVAEAALEAGASLVNDIYGLRTEGMAGLLADRKVPVVLMHMQGNPQDMQSNPSYDSVVEEVYRFFSKQIDFAIDSGIKRENIVLDPGIGFGKRLEHNLSLLRHLREFKSLGLPLLVGVSRKSFIGELLDLPVEERLEGSLAAASVSVLKGADIVRVQQASASGSNPGARIPPKLSQSGLSPRPLGRHPLN